jgi:two-component system chemotaxis response regulator CheB
LTYTAFALSVDDPVGSVRPSIDVLLTSAAETFESRLIAVVLSGARADGAQGMAYVKQLGGLCIVLDRLETEFSTLPHAALKQTSVDYVSGMQEIITLLCSAHEPS